MAIGATGRRGEGIPSQGFLAGPDSQCQRRMRELSPAPRQASLRGPASSWCRLESGAAVRFAKDVGPGSSINQKRMVISPRCAARSPKDLSNAKLMMFNSMKSTFVDCLGGDSRSLQVLYQFRASQRLPKCQRPLAMQLRKRVRPGLPMRRHPIAPMKHSLAAALAAKRAFGVTRWSEKGHQAT